MRALMLIFVLSLAAMPARAQRPVFFGYLALGTSGTSWSELSASGYARQPVTMGPPSSGVSANAAGLSFGPAGVAWGTITEHALYDAPSGGNLIAWWPLTVQSVIGSGGTVSIPAGQIRLSLPELASAGTYWNAGSVIGTTAMQQPVTAGVNLVAPNGVVAAAPSAGSSASSGGTASVTPSDCQGGTGSTVTTVGTGATTVCAGGTARSYWRIANMAAAGGSYVYCTDDGSTPTLSHWTFVAYPQGFQDTTGMQVISPAALLCIAPAATAITALAVQTGAAP